MMIYEKEIKNMKFLSFFSSSSLFLPFFPSSSSNPPLLLVSIMGTLFDPASTNRWMPPQCNHIRVVTRDVCPRKIPFPLVPSSSFITITYETIDTFWEKKEYLTMEKDRCVVLLFSDEMLDPRISPFFEDRVGKIISLEHVNYPRI